MLFIFPLDILTDHRWRNSDGESDHTSGASDESHGHTPVRRRQRPPAKLQRRFSEVRISSHDVSSVLNFN